MGIASQLLRNIVPHKCPKKTVLLKDYQELVHRFRESLAAIDGYHHSKEHVKSEEIRKACEAARRELETHRADHGC
jgi:hypothetical protein